MNRIFSFPPVISPAPKILLLGTMPGTKSLEYNQYYAHSGNHFWKIMFALFNKPFSSSYTDRTSLIKENRLALWDVLKACERDGSADYNITVEEPNEIAAFLETHISIKAIAFNGKNAATYYHQYFGSALKLPTIILPSTSSANSWKTFNQKVEEWAVIKDWLDD
jgi:hypoxanthine-DNA glycosylase